MGNAAPKAAEMYNSHRTCLDKLIFFYHLLAVGSFTNSTSLKGTACLYDDQALVFLQFRERSLYAAI